MYVLNANVGMLPKQVADDLRQGKTSQAQSYVSATVFFRWEAQTCFLFSMKHFFFFFTYYGQNVVKTAAVTSYSSKVLADLPIPDIIEFWAQFEIYTRQKFC